jgi:ATP-dependent DNA helicase DinG
MGRSVGELLAVAVRELGGTTRPGQLVMAEAVAAAMADKEHLLVQAGTGTGKSLGYLVPALLNRRPVVIATATLGLQAQLVRRDLPRLVAAAATELGRTPTFAILKGRNNYVCKHRLGGGESGDSGEDSLFGSAALEAPTSALGREVMRARAWAEETDTGDRDDLVPGVSDRAWAQVAVSSRECLGATRCPQGAECFSELARGLAGEADVVVTNHALLAIDALESIPVLPDHGAVVIDEAHELIDRVSAVATAELTPAMAERAARAATRVADERAVEILSGVADGVAATLAQVEPGALRPMPDLLRAELAALRDAARAVLGSISTSKDDGADVLLAKRIARVGVEEIVETAGRLAAPTEWDVAWLSVEERRGRVLRVAPLSVAGLLRDSLFATRTVVLTSATLAIGGNFEHAVRSFGLPIAGNVESQAPMRTEAPSGLVDVANDAEGAQDEPGTEGDAVAVEAKSLRWRAMDVGSPFDYRKQAILYVARHLPPPGRDGLSDAALEELAELIECAGGRTLGLFSSRRVAEQTVDALRPRLSVPVLCQGDDTLSELVRQFTEDPSACLFGTLSLWHGIDVPGASCQLVAIDRIPFPRPDEPLAAARARAADEAGGNGFMSVYAAAAAVRLAQGAGRLVRSDDDRGVVAVLDSRFDTARYGRFLRSSLPPFWYSNDPTVVRAALRRLSGQADPIVAGQPL